MSGNNAIIAAIVADVEPSNLQVLKKRQSLAAQPLCHDTDPDLNAVFWKDIA